MKKSFYLLLLVFSFSLISHSCLEDLFGDRDDKEEASATSSANHKPAYEFSFTCPGGTKTTVTIPKGTEKCQKAQEYFSKTYGCNEADYFNQANCKVCNDCQWENYCTLCK